MGFIIESMIEFFVAIFATVSFAVLFSAPKKELLLCGLTGAIGWIVYFIMINSNFDAVFASAIAAFVLSVFARLFAAIKKQPVTVYLLTGIFPLVPGAGIFYTAYYLFMGDNSTAGAKGVLTFKIAGAMVLGIIFGFSIPQKLFSKLSKSKTTDC